MDFLYDEGSEITREEFELFEKLIDEEHSKMPSIYFSNRVVVSVLVDWNEELKKLKRKD